MWQHWPGGELLRQPPPWAEADAMLRMKIRLNADRTSEIRKTMHSSSFRLAKQVEGSSATKDIYGSIYATITSFWMRAVAA
jgi:hypothetical protein